MNMFQLNQSLKFTILGSGTSTGVPTIACDCPTCTSNDFRDKRLRTSLLIQTVTTNIVIDTSPDFRQQMLIHKVRHLDALIYTHSHYDHIGGFDDLRAFNFQTHAPISVFASQNTIEHLKRVYPYAFGEADQIGGGIPIIDVRIIDSEPFEINGIEFIPIPMKHGILDVMGYRVGDFAYCTDTNHIPEDSMKLLNGLKILILDALRYEKHPTHFNIQEAMDIVKILRPEITYFTHIAHQIKHAETELTLPPNIRLSYDGISFVL